MFNVSLFLYNISDIVEETEDRGLYLVFRSCFKELDNTRRGIMFEALSKLSKEKLALMKLEFQPKTPRYYATLFTLPKDPKFRTFIIFKDETDRSQPSYIVSG